MMSAFSATLLDKLQNTYQKIHFFGLGFIQVKVSKTERYHFYHTALLPFSSEDEIHDHRYHFRSETLVGALTQEVWDVRWEPTAASTPYLQRLVSCDPAVPVTDTEVRTVWAHKSFTTTVATGSSYEIEAGVYHRVLPVKKHTVTRIIRGPQVLDFASVVAKAGTPEVCPFSRPMDAETMWSHVAECLQDA